MRRQSPCSAVDARNRFRSAQSFLLVGQLVLEQDSDEQLHLENVAASLAVLCGIAASDAACCAALGVRHRGEDHRQAVALLRTVQPHGEQMAKDLARLLQLKDNAQYGILAVAPSTASDAVKWAARMVQLCREIVA